MRIYFSGPGVTVTSDYFVHREPTTTRTFLVRDLRDVCIARSAPARARTPLFLGGAVLALVVAAPLWHISVLFASAFLVLAVLAGVAVAPLLRGRPRPWMLEGLYRGEPVRLYETTDFRVFNQVSRALRRAVEEARVQAPPGDRPAA